MIPASSFLLDGDTALVVCQNVEGNDWEHLAFWHGSDRPCNCTLGRSGTMPDCHGTGRHTFDIEVEVYIGRYDGEHGFGEARYFDTFRVHVIDVRNILGSASDPWIPCEDDEEPTTLPPDAAPGKWLVRLAVHP